MNSEEKSTAAVQQRTKRKEEAKRVPERKEAKGAVVYIGPAIKDVAVAGGVYTNGLPERLKDEIGRRPALRELVVPVEKLAEAKKELAKPGSALAEIYKRAAGR